MLHGQQKRAAAPVTDPGTAGHVAFLFICLPGLSLLVSALFRWRCNISVRLSPRSDWWCPPCSAGHAACLFISQVCHCWCPPLSVGHAAFLFMCLPGLSLVVSALFRWPCSISIHLSPRSVTAGVRPFPLAMQHFYSFVSQVCHWWCPPFSAGHAACLFISQFYHCWCPPLPVGHAAFLFMCLPALFRWHFYSFVSQVCHWCVLVYWP